MQSGQTTHKTMPCLVQPLWFVTLSLAASDDRHCVNYRRAGERLTAPTATAICRVGGLQRLAWTCVCGSVRFRPEQICAVTDSVSEQQWSVRSIPNCCRWLILVLQTYYSIAVLYLFISDRTRWSLFVDFVQDELPCIADYVVSLARNTDVIEKELQECDHLIEETNLGSWSHQYVL